MRERAVEAESRVGRAGATVATLMTPRLLVGLDRARVRESYACPEGARNPQPHRSNTMPVRPSDLHAIPLFQNITEAHLTELMAAFERRKVAADHVLFE